MIYFAHSRQIYNTELEKDLLKFLPKKFGRRNICCPNNDMGELGSIVPYLHKVMISDKVVVHQYKDHLGKGAYQEVRRALSEGIPVRIIIPARFRKYRLKKVKRAVIVDLKDWKVKYGQAIT